jgi:hypothetical protein
MNWGFFVLLLFEHGYEKKKTFAGEDNRLQAFLSSLRGNGAVLVC